MTLAGADDTITTTRAGDGVVHLRYAVDHPARPWQGLGPLDVASLSGKLGAETVKALADESSGPRGSLLPVQVDGEDPTLVNLKADGRTLAGRASLVQGSDWDAGQTGGKADSGPESSRRGSP